MGHMQFLFNQLQATDEQNNSLLSKATNYCIRIIFSNLCEKSCI
jgi:hypothetical protein